MYPEVEPYNYGHLKVSPLHTLYYEEIGNPDGVPVVFLHGGPGGGIYANCRTFFNPKFFRVVLFDQRGSGKSVPFACIEDNTTPLLIEDIEKIRNHLNIKKWIVIGGSWGSTLALAYAISHPNRVAGMVLRGVFLGRTQELNWLYGPNGAGSIFPEEYLHFTENLTDAEKQNVIHAYHKKLTTGDRQEQAEAVSRWNRWESSISQLVPDPYSINSLSDYNTGLAIARIECHYFVNNIFLPDEHYLLRGAAQLGLFPTRIINGRYDIVCPVRTAYELHNQMENSQLYIVPDAGHSTTEPGIGQALADAMDSFMDL